jgi:4-hydroxy-4-methyl-2-oxoglutarate aldolase
MCASAFAGVSPTTLADFLTRNRVMDSGIRPMWTPIPRLAGPAFPVRCGKGDNLMLHAAIHRAPAGAVIVVKGDHEYAMSGGNVCAWAQKRGIAGFVVDGLIRDVAEVRERGFPVFARGVIPIPGDKRKSGVLNGPVTCGGVRVEPGDIVVADEEGIVVLEAESAEDILREAIAKAAKDAAMSLEDWARAHRERVDKAVRQLGYRQ